MSIANGRVRATVAVSDMRVATTFYEQTLGLTPADAGGMDDHVRGYECAGGSQLQVYVSEHAGTGSATTASWSIDDYDAVIDELLAKGVTFDHVDGIEADERGVHASAATA
ncbi:MAG: VOC family protein [Solirubrobacterales bacterium]